MRNPWDDWPPEEWPRLSLGKYLALALIVIALLAIAKLGRAAPRAAIDCRELAVTVQVAAWARDMGADQNKVGIFFRVGYREQVGEPLARAIEREVRRVWHEKLPAAAAVMAAHKRCQAVLGELGVDG